MTWLHPWAIFAGIAAVGLPIVIHWLTRPRPRRVALSTVRFVIEAVKQRRAKHRLRDLIILLLRAAAVLAVAWAFARPLVGSKALVAGGEGGDAVRVVIVDVSQSMDAISHGMAAMERARPAAAKFLDYESGLRANLILAAGRPRGVFDGLSSNFAALRDELGRARVLPQRMDAGAAIRLAGEMLGKAPEGRKLRRELVIVSDFQRANWAGADFSPLPKDTLIQLESVAPAEGAQNLAILRVGAQGRAEQGREMRLEVEVGNYSATSRQVQVEVAMGESAYRMEGLCPANATATLSAEVAMPAAGWQVGEAKLIGAEDALAADNVRPVALNVRPSPTYGLITREPARPQPSSSHYMERALAPMRMREGQRGERVLRIDPGQVDRETLGGTDLIVVDHPGKLSQDAVGLLAGLMRRGKPVLYVAAETVDATNLKLLTDAAGADLKMPVEFEPPMTGQVRKDLFLYSVESNSAPFSVFGDGLQAVVGSLRFSGGLGSRALATGLKDDVLATYSDQSACLVVSQCAAGSLAVLNADLAASNLPASPAFVPLVGEVVGRLLGERRSEEAIVCGEPVLVELPPEAGAKAGLRIAGPQGGDGAGEEAGQLVEEKTGVTWQWPAAGAPGVYRIQRNGQTAFAAACAIPAAEADLRPLDANVMKERLAGGRKVHYRAAMEEDQGKDDWWTWMAMAAAACLMLEVVVLRLFKT